MRLRRWGQALFCLAFVLGIATGAEISRHEGISFGGQGL